MNVNSMQIYIYRYIYNMYVTQRYIYYIHIIIVPFFIIHIRKNVYNLISWNFDNYL